MRANHDAHHIANAKAPHLRGRRPHRRQEAGRRQEGNRQKRQCNLHRDGGAAWRAGLFPARLLCLLSSVELRNSSECRLNPKQNEAFSAACLPAGPEVPCFTRDLISHLGISFFWSPPKPTHRRSLSYVFASAFFSFLLVGSCSLLPALSLSPYDAPTPPTSVLKRLTLSGAHARSVTRGKRQTRGKVQGVLRAPLPHSPPSQIVARPRATIPDNTQQPRRHGNIHADPFHKSDTPPLLSF